MVGLSAFLDSFDSQAPAPVYLFCPHKAPRARAATFEPILADRGVSHMVEALVDPSMRDMCYGAYYADETVPGEIVSNAETLPFLTDRRVILVRGAERYGSEAAMGALLRYLETPCETTVLIFVAQQVDKRSKFFKACDKNGEIIECGALRDREVSLWIHEELKELDKKMDPAAVQELINRVGTSLSDVHNALNLVSAYVGESPKIAASDVAEACADVAEEEVWALTDAIAQSNTKNALRVLRALYDLGKSEFEVLGSINWLLKTAYGVAAAAPSDPILRSFPGKKCKPLADKFGAKKLGDAFGLLVETDFMLRSTGVDRSLALELLVIKLAAPGRRRRSA